MKKLFLFTAICLFAAVAAVAQQSLGDVARANRASKRATATTNLSDDNFARSNAPAAQSPAKEDAASKDADKSEDKTADAKDASAKDGKDAKKDTAASQNEKLKGQIEAQKKEIAQLQRELDVAEREARLRAAAYYADAGVMLRDQAKFAEDSRKAQSEIDGKKQALADAKGKLDDLEEQARKAGLPSGD
jgi:hypothetical protein